MDEINIESEDLEDLPEPPAAAPAPEVVGELLVIEAFDLEEAAPLPAAYPSAEPAAADALPGKSTVGLAQVAGRGLLSLALAGAVGGLLAWALNEPFTNDLRAPGDLLTVLMGEALFGAIFGGLIGAALGSAEGVSAGVADKALHGAGLGLIIGGAGGALGGLCGQVLYGALQEQHPHFLHQVLLRAVAWALVGVFIGLGQGAQGATPRKLLNGVLGGAIGGFVGGFLFDPIAVTVHQLLADGNLHEQLRAHGGWVSRMVAMTVTGLCTGAAIGLVSELRKEAWLAVISGPLSGKQFILYRAVTTLGSSPKADICLLKDPAIRPQHLVLQQAGAGHLLLTSPESPVALNARATTHHHLHNGDLIGLGQTVLQYRLRAVPPGPG